MAVKSIKFLGYNIRGGYLTKTPGMLVFCVNYYHIVLLLCHRESYFTRGLQITSIIFPRVFGFCEAPPIITFYANSLNLALPPKIAVASTLACLCPLQTCPPLTPRTPPLAHPLCLCPCPGLPWPLHATSHAHPPDVQCWDPSGCKAPWIAHSSSASVCATFIK